MDAPALPDPELLAHPAFRNEDVVAYILLLLLVAVICLGVVCALLVAQYLRRGRREGEYEPPALVTRLGGTTQPRGVVLLPDRWVAVRAPLVRDVRNALGLANTRPCPLEDAFNHPRHRGLYLTPPVNGWIMIFGPAVPDPAGDVDAVYHFVRGLGQRLGNAQYFHVHPPTGAHGWAWARGGRVVRGFAWAGKTLWNEGEATREERQLGCACPPLGGTEPDDEALADELRVNLDKVPRLAAAWGMDPVALLSHAAREPGVTGEFAGVRPA
ncbi:MAG: hypothetical protein ACKVYV_19440 [Limisphaerales bacterium]